jgi:hypothetical protein
MTELNFAQLQFEVGEWSRRNFPNNTRTHPLLGIIEEIGELDAAVGAEDINDAIADAVIYLADYCSRNSLTVPSSYEGNLEIHQILGDLCHYHLKGEQGIRHSPEEILTLKENSVARLLEWLRLQCEFDESFDRIVLQTWAKVSQRDWRKNKVDGFAA